MELFDGVLLVQSEQSLLSAEAAYAAGTLDALALLDAETGVVMLLYLDLAWERRRTEGRMASRAYLSEAVHEGAVQRIRPKAMTVTTTFIALLPILWATGTGADVMRRIAAPMVGGIVTSFLVELLVYPVVYFIWRSRGLGGRGHATAPSGMVDSRPGA